MTIAILTWRLCAWASEGTRPRLTVHIPRCENRNAETPTYWVWLAWILTCRSSSRQLGLKSVQFFKIWIVWKTIIWHLIWGIFDHMTIKFGMQSLTTEPDNSTIKIKIGQKISDRNQSKSFAKGGAQQETGGKSSCLRAIWKFWSFICICQSGKGQKAELSALKCCKLIDDNSAWFVSLLLFLVLCFAFFMALLESTAEEWCRGMIGDDIQLTATSQIQTPGHCSEDTASVHGRPLSLLWKWFKLAEVTLLSFVKPEDNLLLLRVLILSYWAASFCWAQKGLIHKLLLAAIYHLAITTKYAHWLGAPVKDLNNIR